MSRTHTLTFPVLVGRTYTVTATDNTYNKSASESVTVSSSGSSVSLDITSYVSEITVTNCSLSYSPSSIDYNKTATPTLSYELEVIYTDGTTATITDGATVTYAINDSDPVLQVDSSTGVVSALSSVLSSDNLTLGGSDTITATISYSYLSVITDNDDEDIGQEEITKTVSITATADVLLNANAVQIILNALDENSEEIEGATIYYEINSESGDL